MLAPRATSVLKTHSYGGVFVLHALFTRPAAFTVYAAADPSLWWGEGHMLREESDALHVTAPAPALYLWTGEGGAAAAAPRTPPAGRSPEAVAAMQRARGSVPADATQRMAERQRARGLPVHWTPLPGLSHGQTLGASLPLLLQALAGETLAAGEVER